MKEQLKILFELIVMIIKDPLIVFSAYRENQEQVCISKTLGISDNILKIIWQMKTKVKPYKQRKIVNKLVGFNIPIPRVKDIIEIIEPYLLYQNDATYQRMLLAFRLITSEGRVSKFSDSIFVVSCAFDIDERTKIYKLLGIKGLEKDILTKKEK